MVVLFCRKLPQFQEILLFIREMNEPVMALRGKIFHNYYTNRVVHVFKAILQRFRLNTLKLIHIFGNILITVNSCCYAWSLLRKKNLIPLCTLLKFHTYLEKNLARSFQNVFDKCSRVLNLAFSRNYPLKTLRQAASWSV